MGFTGFTRSVVSFRGVQGQGFGEALTRTTHNLLTSFSRMQASGSLLRDPHKPTSKASPQKDAFFGLFSLRRETI